MRTNQPLRSYRKEQVFTSTRKTASDIENNSTIKSIKHDLASLSSKLARPAPTSREISGLRTENNCVRNDISQLKEKHEALRNEFMGYKDELFKKNERINSIKSQIAQADIQIESYLRENQVLQKAKDNHDFRENAVLTKYNSEISTLNHKLDFLRQSDTKSREVHRSLESDLKTTQEKLSRLRQENKEMEELQLKLLKEKEELRKELADMDEDICHNKSRIQDNTAKIQENLELFKHLGGDYERVILKLQDMENKCRALTEENNRLRAASNRG